MSKRIRWGILATGAIAQSFTRGVKTSQTGELVAVGSRSIDKAQTFGKNFGIANYHGTYQKLLADPTVEAVYISTPHPQHAEWSIKAAEAGKHVLVEKPIGLNQYEAEAIINAALENKVFLMEAYMYRCHPQTGKLVELLHANTIGDLRVIQATFSFSAEFSPDSRLWSNALAGGGIMDVGGYTTSIARLVAGVAQGKPFTDPISVNGAGALHPETNVDAWAVGTLKFSGDIVASISTGVGVNQENVLRIFGSEGSILVPNPFMYARDGTTPGKIIVNRDGEKPREYNIDSQVTSYAHEVDVCGRAIRAGSMQAESPSMTWEDTLGNIQTQDNWRTAIGLTFDTEKPENLKPVTVANRTLRVRSKNPIPLGKIEHLEKPISRLILGFADSQTTMPHAASVFDDYFERGGNTFDTAYIYGEHKSHLLGQWITARGVREQVAVIVKGAHTPNCNPLDLSTQLIQQLKWLSIDCADIYMMHRDNPDIPVSEFIDILNEHVRAGRIKAFGGSNWNLGRVHEANSYAKSKNLQGFSVISNNLSLAEMVKPVWEGCIHVHDIESRKWLQRSKLALLPWSSQARGFFVPSRAYPHKRDNTSLVNSWYSDDNFKRQTRAIELARKYQVEPINIALAWVLCQPFPIFPMIGPRTISETRSCVSALEVSLEPGELKYLDLDD